MSDNIQNKFDLHPLSLQKPAHPAGCEACLLSPLFESHDGLELIFSPGLGRREEEPGVAVKLSVSKPHLLPPEFDGTLCVRGWEILLLTGCGALLFIGVCGIGSSEKACHVFGSGFVETLSRKPC